MSRALAVFRLMTSSNFGRLLHEQVGKLLLEDTVDVARCASELVDNVIAVGDQAASGDLVAVIVDWELPPSPTSQVVHKAASAPNPKPP
jgi:hypothetical protein